MRHRWLPLTCLFVVFAIAAVTAQQPPRVARPDPDVKYFSNSIARSVLANGIETTNFHRTPSAVR